MSTDVFLIDSRLTIAHRRGALVLKRGEDGRLQMDDLRSSVPSQPFHWLRFVGPRPCRPHSTMNMR